MILRRLLAALAPLPLLLAGLQLPAEAAPERGAAGIGDPYFPWDGNGGIDVRRYTIRAGYDFSTGLLTGRTTVRLRATRDLLTFNLDLLLRVRSVRVDGVRAAFHKPSAHELRIRPARPLAAGRVVDVEVRYAGKPGRRTYLGESSWLARRGEVAAVNEPHMAPWWFPANDHPRDAAVVDLRMRVPRGMQVIGNGLLRGVHRGRSTTVWHWRATEPMAPYLAFFTAGRFRMERHPTPVGTSVVAVSRLLGEHTQDEALRVLRRTDEQARRLAALIGTPYPFTATGGVVSGVLRGFALENQTRPVYPGFVTRGLVAHEIAHQWFGNRVRLHAWQHVWLNEGFATWFAQALAGGEAAAARRLRADYDSRGVEDPFWLVPPGAPGRARIFDPAVYERGAMTLMALRNRIGDSDFDQVVRRWAGRTAPATTQAFTALAEQVSGQDLSAFFEAWLKDPRKPAATPELGLG